MKKICWNILDNKPMKKIFTVFPNTLSVLNANLILKLRKKLLSIWYHFISSMFNNVSFAPTPVLIQHGLTIIFQRNINKLESTYLNSKKSLCQVLNLPYSLNGINHEKEMLKPFSQFVLDNKPMKNILRKKITSTIKNIYWKWRY